MILKHNFYCLFVTVCLTLSSSLLSKIADKLPEKVSTTTRVQLSIENERKSTDPNTITCATAKNNKILSPALVVVLMVKNEEPVIVETVAPMLQAGIDAFYIFDTGSEDKTVQRIYDYFKEKKVTQAYITQEPFIDYSTSRNRALDLAEEKFPHAAFMLMPDAEWYLNGGEKLIEFCKHFADPVADNNLHSYLIQIRSINQDFYHQRLIRCRSNLRFAGLVHESPTVGTWGKIDNSIYFELRSTRFGFEKTIKRMQTRDIPMLTKMYQENPHSPRTVFYLAQTYECLADWENAYKFYKRRLEIVGSPEENYMAHYKLARAAQHLGSIDHVEAWPIAQKHYLIAYGMRPQRAEPLVRLAEYYLMQDNFALSFLFASKAVTIPYPQDEMLFIEKQLYQFTRYHILSHCAWYVGEYDIGEQAACEAIKAQPDNMQVRKNLEYYLERKSQSKQDNTILLQANTA